MACERLDTAERDSIPSNVQVAQEVECSRLTAFEFYREHAARIIALRCVNPFCSGSVESVGKAPLRSTVTIDDLHSRRLEREALRRKKSETAEGYCKLMSASFHSGSTSQRL